MKETKWNVEMLQKELAEIVNIDSGSSDKDGVAAVCSWFEDRFLREGFPFVQIREESTQLQVQTHEQDLFDVLLVGHMDTVFPKGTAAQRPYHEENGKAYGPGVADMKAGLVLILHIMKRLRIERPDLKLCAAFSGDEEIGSDSTAEWLKSLAERSRFALVLEPGREGNGFVRSRKGCADLRVKFYGKAAHAGNAPERGINTVVAMAEWIRKLYVFHQPETGTTVNPGLVWGGTAKNVIPDYAEAVFDIRFMEAEALEKICGKAEELAANPPVAGIRTEISLEGVFPPMTPSEETKEYMSKLEKIAASFDCSIGWKDAGGVSDANHIASVGTPVLCGCGPVGGELHSEREWLDLTTIEPRLKLLYALICDLR